MQSCKAKERELDAQGIRPGTNGTSPQQIDSRSTTQSSTAIALPKSKAYLKALFNHLVEKDKMMPNPIFTGNFDPDNFCFSIQEEPEGYNKINAKMHSASGHTIWTPEMLLLRPELSHWQTMAHEISHALLAHQHSFSETTFPIPNEQEQRKAIDLRIQQVRDRKRAYLSFRKTLFSTPPAFVEYMDGVLKKIAANEPSSPWEKILNALQAALGVRVGFPQQDEDASAIFALAVANSPDNVCNSDCKKNLLASTDELMRNEKLLKSTESELYSLMSRYYSREYLENGKEFMADSLGDYLLSRAGFHPATSGLSWIIEMILAGPFDQGRDAQISSFVKEPTLAGLIKTGGPDLGPCLFFTAQGKLVSPGLRSHPPDCFRFQAAIMSRIQEIDPARINEVSKTPKLTPSLTEVQQEIRAAYERAGRPQPILE
jgi:hypothetical protein